jgi:diguanylate cyclase (GGDEF)-like protein
LPVILVVDDDSATRVLIRTALESDGYRVLEAEGGQTALSIFESEEPDLILMDAAMPSMSGFETCCRLKKLSRGAETPVLFVTGLDDERSVHRGFEVGATDYITKPVHWGVARQRVRRLLETSYQSRQLKHLAYHDPLTGLPNRRLLMDRASMALAGAKRNRTLLAVLVLDLDSFKHVNDSFGHDVGDRVLCIMAERVAECMRENDTVARLGGDELIVLLEVMSISDIELICGKVLAAVRDSIVEFGRPIRLSSSIGGAFFPRHAPDIVTLLRYADQAMYTAKRTGGNRYCFHEA